MKCKPQADDRTAFMLVATPITGKVFQIWPRTGEVFFFEWGERRWWRELSPEQFAKECEARQMISLLKAAKVYLSREQPEEPMPDLLREMYAEV